MTDYVWFVVGDSSVILYLLIHIMVTLPPWLVSTDFGTFIIIIIIISEMKTKLRKRIARRIPTV